MTLEEKSKLKRTLKYGDIATIASVCKYSRQSVYEWFTSDRQNITIEQCVQALADTRKDQRLSKVEKLRNV